MSTTSSGGSRWPERARPGRPAPARHQLAAVARVGAGVLIEVLAAQPQHFLQPRFVGPDRGGRWRAPANCASSSGHSGPWPLSWTAGRQPVVGEGAVAFLADQPGVLEQAEMARDPGLREAEDAGQLGDVEAVAREHAEQAQPGLVAEQAKERGGVFHIYKCR